MGEIERVKAKLIELQIKLAKADEPSKVYYRLCIVGWRKYLQKLYAEN